MRPMAKYVDLFFMGAAFLLLETKSVVQFALLFGTTWFVNALVFAGVLVSVLAAIEVARRWRPARPELLYVALLAAIAVAWVVPVEFLLGLEMLPRFLLAVVVWFTPIFIANLVFAERFRNVEESNVAFGANLLGAMVGGLLEYVALLTGYQALLWSRSCTGRPSSPVGGSPARADDRPRLAHARERESGAARSATACPDRPSAGLSWSPDYGEAADAAEQPVRLVIRTRREVERVGCSGRVVVAERDRPQAVDREDLSRDGSA